MKPNILLITADDLNYNSCGIFGSKVSNITPNIDKFATEGMCFQHSHVTIAVCQPSRQAMMTGRYPHRNGAPGFDPIDEDVPTLQEELKKAGYINGVLGKVDHLAPEHKYCWDYVVHTIEKENGWGRKPQKYYEFCKEFIQKAKKEDKPFFFMANSHDPHRPFAGSEDEIKKFGHHTEVSYQYTPDEIEVPPFLPDIPDVRKELAQYFSSVHRCDETVGELLRALDEMGMTENTIVMFLSDNGMAFPFAKTNCYLNSTRTPWIIRWPKKIKPGIKDEIHFISGIDFMPTILEIVGLPESEGMDGKSFLPLLEGENQKDRDKIFTEFNTTAAKRKYPMRCVRNHKYGYIFNTWSDESTFFKNESKFGLTYKAMVEAAQNDKQIESRVQMFDYRVKEEFYDFQKDPDALNNLINDPNYRDMIIKFKNDMYDIMKATDDPELEQFKNLC